MRSHRRKWAQCLWFWASSSLFKCQLVTPIEGISHFLWARFSLSHSTAIYLSIYLFPIPPTFTTTCLPPLLTLACHLLPAISCSILPGVFSFSVQLINTHRQGKIVIGIQNPVDQEDQEKSELMALTRLQPSSWTPDISWPSIWVGCVCVCYVSLKILKATEQQQQQLLLQLLLYRFEEFQRTLVQSRL